MRYVEFRDLIQTELAGCPKGKTWTDLRDGRELPYDRPWPTWVKQIREDIGLSREKGSDRALLWTVKRG